MAYRFSDAPVPITVVTGYLGAGKTTLLNRILTGDHERRIAVIQNEFGEVSIDHDLILSVEENITTLVNGCICCTVQDDMVEALDDLLDRRASFDHLVIETSGLAEPASLIMTLLNHPQMGESFLLDGVVAMADAFHLERQLEEAPEAAGQLAYADRILLNKIDLVGSADSDPLVKRILAINPLATIERTSHAATDAESLLEIGGFDLQRFTPGDLAAAHHHRAEISSVSIVLPGSVDLVRFEQWIAMLLGSRHETLYRMKGILDLAGQSREYIFQSVHSLSSWEYGRAWGEGERTNRFVIIGRDLDEAFLREGFLGCIETKE